MILMTAIPGKRIPNFSINKNLIQWFEEMGCTLKAVDGSPNWAKTNKWKYQSQDTVLLPYMFDLQQNNRILQGYEGNNRTRFNTTWKMIVSSGSQIK